MPANLDDVNGGRYTDLALAIDAEIESSVQLLKDVANRNQVIFLIYKIIDSAPAYISVCALDAERDSGPDTNPAQHAT